MRRVVAKPYTGPYAADFEALDGLLVTLPGVLPLRSAANQEDPGLDETDDSAPDSRAA